MISDIISIEANFSSWLNLSIILLTVSLVFFHMSHVGSIKVPRKMAGIISCSLIGINIIFTINSIIPYYDRTNTMKTNNELVYRDIYFYTAILFVSIEIIICVYMIKDSFA